MEQLYSLIVDGEIANTGLLHIAVKAQKEWQQAAPEALVEYRPDIPKTKIQDLLLQMSFIDVSSLIHAVSDAIRHTCGLARAMADLGVKIDCMYDHAEDDGWMRTDIEDISDKHELVDLITLASMQLKKLSTHSNYQDHSS